MRRKILIDEPQRASAIRSGDLHIDVAFLGAPSCDPYGNANGYSRDGEDGIACGSLGYARPDATYADNVIVITNHLVAYPNAPWAIPEFEVDYVVMTDDIGDPKGIMSGATRCSSGSRPRRRGCWAARPSSGTSPSSWWAAMAG